MDVFGLEAKKCSALDGRPQGVLSGELNPRKGIENHRTTICVVLLSK